MADISQITVGSTTYNIKDSTARSSASSASTAAASAQTTANSALAAASSAQTTANSALALASSASSAATSALALASTALAAASSAQTTANSAQTTANTAYNLATTAIANASQASIAATSAYAHGDDAIAASSAVQSALASHIATYNAHGVTLANIIGTPYYIAPTTHTYASSITGGYAQYGPLVIVNMSVTVQTGSNVTAGARNMARYFPDPVYATSFAVTASDTAAPRVSARLTGAGILQFITYETIPSGSVYYVGGIYMTNQAQAYAQVTQDSSTGDLTIE